MRSELYLEDSYCREFTATVKSVKDGKYVVLDRTAFYPASGGQPHDLGVIEKDGETYEVVYVGKFDGEVSHEVDREGLAEGDEVEGAIDWERRHRLMRMHTAAHVLMQAMYLDMGAMGTGNQLKTDVSRIDFSLDEYDPDLMKKAIDDANEVLGRDLPVAVEFMPREEAMEIEGVTKLAKGLPAHLEELRIVRIGDYDVQADGGTHVESTGEVGTVIFERTKNKGKGRKRLYFSLEP